MTARFRAIAVSGTLVLSLLTGCASLSTQRFANHLTHAMLDQNDPEIVRAGIPSYLLLLDLLIQESPKDADLLMAGAKLYDAYASVIVDDPARRRQLTERALEYAGRALCGDHPLICKARQGPYREFVTALDQAENLDEHRLFVFGAVWAGWIQARSDDWNAVADLAKVELVLQRVVETDPEFEDGRAQLYLGILSSLVSPALGGQPERGREYFERAIRISGGKDLMAKVAFARYYARIVFDETLHDRLLHEVIDADPDWPGLTLSNTLAQQQARQLLADDYF